MQKVILSTDGACKGNPGPGGYCGILRLGEHRCTTEGFIRDATNNKMELLAVIKSVEKLTRPCEILVRTDSRYVISCINWLDGKSKAKANKELLVQLLSQKEYGHKFTFQYIKGHSGDPDNEECDRRAKAQIELCLLKGEADV